MNPHDEWRTFCLLKHHICKNHSLINKSFSPHIIPKTKGLEESLGIE